MLRDMTLKQFNAFKHLEFRYCLIASHPISLFLPLKVTVALQGDLFSLSVFWYLKHSCHVQYHVMPNAVGLPRMATLQRNLGQLLHQKIFQFIASKGRKGTQASKHLGDKLSVRLV